MAQAYSYLRFSTPQQSSGHSIERQDEAAANYAREHNLTLDTHSFRDLGISAFKGKNLRDGALGAFLAAVDKGVIPKGSTLLVENIDRLSRAQVDEALELFLSIIRRDIIIVTLMDKQVYSKEKIREDKGISLIISITYMMRAHEESATKSDRIKKANLKNFAALVPNPNYPGWLVMNEKRDGYEVDETKAATIRLMFDMALNGRGMHLICRHLQHNKIGPVTDLRRKATNETGWSVGSVARILKHYGVIGEMYSRSHNKVYEGMYPAVIERDLFFRVQAKMAERHRVGSGRKGENVRNLFSGLCYCGVCGNKMKYERTVNGSGTRVNEYLKCYRIVVHKGFDGFTYFNQTITIAGEVVLDERVDFERVHGIDVEGAVPHQWVRFEGRNDQEKDFFGRLWDWEDENKRKSDHVITH